MSQSRFPYSRALLVDSSAYFALLDADDANHSQALVLRDRIVAEGWRLITTSFLLAETHALLLNRLSKYSATQFLHEMQRSANMIVWITPADVERVSAIIYQYDDKAFSLADATSFAIMERLGVPYAFTFDADFTQYGLNILR